MDSFQVSPIPARLLAPLRAALRGERGEWPEVSGDEVSVLAEHGVAPLVYAVAAVPELRGHAIRAAAMEPLRLADLREVLSALAAKGIDVIVTKGSALAYELYATPEQRPRGDVDLLVSRDHAPAAIALLKDLGFEDRLTSGDEHGVRQVTLTRADRHGVRHEYDLHWDVANTPLFASALRFEELLARSVTLPRIGADARGLCDVDALLLACIHRVAHHHDSERLIWLVDIALLRRRMTEDEHREFWQRAAQERIVSVCVRSIALADEWTSGAPHHEAAEFLGAEEIEREETSTVFLDRKLTYGGVMLANLRALPWRSRFHRLWQLAFPPRAFVLQNFGAGNRLVLPWLYVRRGARGVKRLFRRVS